MRKEIGDLNAELQTYQERFQGDDSILGLNLLTFAPYIDSARCIMFGNHLTQRVVSLDTEFPRVFTNYCNAVGDNSSYNTRAKANMQVVKIIEKFEKLHSPVAPKLIFVHNLDDDTYDVIERHEVENLPEKYGFEYDNSRLDKLQVDDIIKDGDTLYRPTSFDEFGNYGYGRNIRFMYEVHDQNIEDAIQVSERLAKTFLSTEVETVKYIYNENNVMLNIYGDRDHYRCFPGLGEHIKDKRVAILRTVTNAQLLFDMKEINTREQLSTDSPRYNDGQIVDIDIFCNKPRDEVIRANFNEQVLEYLDMCDEFFTQVRDYTDELINDGCQVSSAILQWNKKTTEYLDPNYIIKDENGSEFSNMAIRFLVRRRTGLLRGQKITGRFGNKGVIAKIVPDHLMPVLETGEQIDVIFDTLGVINRLNVFQLFEQSITFITDRVVQRIRTLSDIKEKEALFFRVIELFNPAQKEEVQADYKAACRTKKEKVAYFDIVEQYGIYIHIEPFWHSKNLYDCLDECYKEFPWIKRYKVFFWEEISGRWVPKMNDQVIGEMYVMKLKQSSKKGLSARSTGSINKKGVPAKSDSAKKHMEPYSKNPIREGKQERMNVGQSVDPEITAVESMLYRSSPVGRRELASQLLDNAFNVADFQLDPTMTNRNVEILSAYLKSMGLELRFQYDILDNSPGNQEKTHRYNGETYICTTERMKEIISKDLARQAYEEARPGAIYVGDQVHVSDFLDELAENIQSDFDNVIYEY